MARTRTKITKLIVEPHPVEYTGPRWLTYIQYINKSRLVIVDSIAKNYLWGYNFDDMDDITKAIFIELMDNYWNSDLYGEPLRKRVPVHEWLYDNNLGSEFGDLLVGYNVNDILRLVGPVRYEDPLSEKMHVRRRKRTLIKVS